MTLTDLETFAHALQVEMFVRGIQAHHVYSEIYPIAAEKRKKKHDDYLQRMATATEYGCSDMEPHVHVGYDLSQDVVVSFNKRLSEGRKFYVIFTYDKDVEVVDYENGKQMLLPFVEDDERSCLVPVAGADHFDDWHYLFQVTVHLLRPVYLTCHKNM